jgi:peptidoglycan/xylan/chitin deacetylase (PgdA/CDA1 family)
MTAQAYELLMKRGDLWDLFTRKDDYHRDRAVENRSLYRMNGRGDIYVAPVSGFLCEHGLRWEYPEGRSFGVCLTHDIDDIYPPGKHMLLSAACSAARLDARGVSRQVAWKLTDRQYSPYRNFREIIRLEKEYGGRSSFYFLGNGHDQRRFRYDVEDLESDLGSIVDEGCEVGLHGGILSYDNLAAIKEEKRRVEKALGRPIRGHRSHYLSLKVPDTWELLAQAGFGYDTTLGYNDRPGFRNGMCHPFRPYSLTTGKPIDIVEIPLTIMEESLFWEGRTIGEAMALSRRLIDHAAACGGVVTLLWHNNAFGASFREPWKRMYAKLLQYCRDKNAWMTSGENMWQWGVKRGYFDD